MNGLQGVQAAAITPRGKNGEVDFGAAFELIDHLCKGGVNGILLFGAAGEYPAFTAEERARLVYLGVKRSRVPVLAGVGSVTLDSSIEFAREARDAGAAALVLPAPHFFRYDQDDLRAFFCQFAAEAGCDPPILVYRDEGLAAETAIELWETGRFEGLIDATGRHGDSRTIVRGRRAGAQRRRLRRSAVVRARGLCRQPRAPRRSCWRHWRARLRRAPRRKSRRSITCYRNSCAGRPVSRNPRR